MSSFFQSTAKKIFDRCIRSCHVVFHFDFSFGVEQFVCSGDGDTEYNVYIEAKVWNFLNVFVQQRFLIINRVKKACDPDRTKFRHHFDGFIRAIEISHRIPRTMVAIILSKNKTDVGIMHQ